MTTPPDKPDGPQATPKAVAKAERAERLAASLRDNLKRRKAARPPSDRKSN